MKTTLIDQPDDLFKMTASSADDPNDHPNPNIGFEWGQFSCTHFIIDFQGSLLNTIVGGGKSWLKGFIEDADSLANDHYGEACQVSLT